jgi:hypothetical protein
MAQSGHPGALGQCPLLGVKRTSRLIDAMSVFDPKRTFPAGEVAYPTPKITSARARQRDLAKYLQILKPTIARWNALSCGERKSGIMI